MQANLEALIELRVRDLMHRDVVTVMEHATMEEAARILAAHAVSATPVIDVAGRCVGILSTYDFARRGQGQDASEEMGGELKHAVVHNQLGQPLSVEGIRENRVGEYMTPAVQTIDPDATIIEAARVFSGARIHHLVVVDDQDRPAGILTTMDLVACMARLSDASTAIHR